MLNFSWPPRPTKSKPAEQRQPLSDLFAHSTLRNTGVDYSGSGRFDFKETSKRSRPKRDEQRWQK